MPYSGTSNESKQGNHWSRRLPSYAPRVKSLVYHWMTVCLLILCMVTVNWIFGTTRDQPYLNPVEAYGYTASIILYLFRLIPLLSIPFCVTNILGITLLNSFPSAPTFHFNKSLFPFLCFRVVTKGLYPELVKHTLERNINTCYNVGLENFKFEVVTDKELGLKKSALIRELVVPVRYVTQQGSLYKARALAYCNEQTVNILSGNDWVIHLDEETVLTESAVIGLVNFACEDLKDIGQGTISYANEDIVNWVTTLADSVRVAVDYGMMRFCFGLLGRPLMGSKGSFIIIRAQVEKEIGFDFGPKGSITEDLMFILKAWDKGYKFGFVDGIMWEKSPFSIKDYLEQRKRWFIGHLFTLLSTEVPLKCKLGLIPTDLGWFLLFGNIINVPASISLPLPLPWILNITLACLGGCMLFMFLFGSIKSFSTRKYGVITKTLIVILTILAVPVAACLDGTASLYGFWTRYNGGFYIVKKNTRFSTNTYHENVSVNENFAL